MEINLNLSFRNIIAFILFGILMGEAHEVSHFIAGKLACGCWPTYRDFNSWQICDCAVGYVATAAGPIFSMTLSWIGMFMLTTASLKAKSFGFVLIWANVPQARIATVLGGGGDEMVVIRQLLEGTTLQDNFKWISIIIVFIMALPPIIAAFVAVKNKWGWSINLGFMVGALTLWGAYLFGLMNMILMRGLLNQVWIMGTPLLITIHTLVVLMLLILFFRKELFTLAREKSM